MAKNVEIISKEIIKPSSPTPTYLKTLKLSLIDQLAVPVYVPLIFFYQPITNPQEISRSLKESLSKTLTIFYPLGGIVQENSSVDCNDSGAEFSEARVGARLSDVIQDANVGELNKLLPSLGQNDNIVLKVRLSLFDCGGVSVGIHLWHKLGDGTSMVAFMEAWAAMCRGDETKISPPSFDLASFFPTKPFSETLDFIQRAGLTEEKLVTKRFLFNKEKIEKLKELNVGTPTRVEAVSSCIWQAFIEAKVSPQTMKSLFVATHVVNMRPRKRPPISQHVFGNCWRYVGAFFSPEQEKDDYSELAVKLRAAIKSMDDDYIKRVGSEEFMEEQRKLSGLISTVGFEFCHFTSWCRFPTYEVDFGWGKPVWVSTTTVPIKNLVILMGTPCGDGIEAWANMLPNDMQLFEQHIG